MSRLIKNAAFSITVSAVFSAAAPASALNSKAQLKACEAKICRSVHYSPAPGQLHCPLQKTWSGSEIKRGARRKNMIWDFGGTTCRVSLRLTRKDLHQAVTRPKYTLVFPEHVLSCTVESDNDSTQIDVTLAPSVEFIDGRAHKAWFNVDSVDGPTLLSGTVWTVAKLQDNVGLFHGDLIKGINKLLHEDCARY